MNRIYTCPKCYTTWGRSEHEQHLCPVCQTDLQVTDLEVETWKKLSEAQKTELKKSWFDEPIDEKALMIHMLQVNQSMAKDIKTMKRILVFFTALWGLMLVLGAVNLL